METKEQQAFPSNLVLSPRQLDIGEQIVPPALHDGTHLSRTSI